MDYRNILKTQHKKVAVILAMVFLFTVASILVFSRTPEFPDEIPSAEQLEVYNNNYTAQKVFFRRYTEFIRDNHGGIILSEEKDGPREKIVKNQIIAIRFLHRFNSFRKSLVFDLTNSFARQENVSFKLSSSSKNGKSVNSSDYFEVEFLKNNTAWVIVEMQVPGGYVDEPSPVKEYGQNPEPDEPATSEDPALSSTGDARLVIVIDDLGNRLDVLNNLIALDYDITYSILPQQQYSLETSEIVFDNGREVMLHLPMEPKEYPKFDPGLGALLIHDRQETIIDKMERNLETVPYAVGINNHMGSAFTQHDEGLDVVMQVLSGRLLFFLDSKTAPGRIAKRSARDYEVPYLSRDIFLDNEREESAIGRQLHKAARIASRRGKAIAIGHPYPETYQALKQYLPVIEALGVRITRISDLINQ